MRFASHAGRPRAPRRPAPRLDFGVQPFKERAWGIRRTSSRRETWPHCSTGSVPWASTRHVRSYLLTGFRVAPGRPAANSPGRPGSPRQGANPYPLRPVNRVPVDPCHHAPLRSRLGRARPSASSRPHPRRRDPHRGPHHRPMERHGLRQREHERSTSSERGSPPTRAAASRPRPRISASTAGRPRRG
jgi:hypothetical protein